MKYSLSPAICELERAYHFFNHELFRGALNEYLIITIQSRGRKNALGWHSRERWKNGETSSISEINLSAEDLKTSDPYEILIHEMAHHWNYQQDIRDVSTGQYHNKYFKETAEMAGLEVKRFGNVGYGVTTLGELAKEKILKFKPEKEVFDILRKADVAGLRKGSKLKKWSCECGMNVRVARLDFDATCNHCMTRFALTEGV